ncbi:ankyrin repeat domain-containing protein [uncultured Amphritea sp.]|uniref:ankyrin repeat domain-containing protein n=1 Tax=uncultured Amphritea sp. TaxID=981605 RepID=UPI0025DD621E|nr:ankyrin repeat domain-containing protein [uncultured Amphritea sp.]
MQSKSNFPYPTLIEIIRSFVKHLDLKGANKALDDKALDRTIDYRQIEKLINESITKPINKYMGPDAADLITEAFNKNLSDYIKIVSDIPADGISRAQMVPILFRCLFRDHVVILLNKISDQFGGPNPVTLLSPNDQAVTITLNWIKKHEHSWNSYLRNLGKEPQDRISAWSRGDDLPSCQYLLLLQGKSKGPWPEHINWPRVRLLLLIARAIESLKRDDSMSDFLEDVRLALWGVNDESDLLQEIESAQRKARREDAEIHQSIAKIEHHCMRTIPKNCQDRDLLRGCIDEARAYLYTTDYWLDWMDARWHAFSGDLEKANELYEMAFNDCLFRAGENQKAIIEEAIVIAASVERPDRVFLKHLKWANTTFRYDLPSISSKQPSNKFSDNIEDWEIHLWKANLSTMFPEDGFFPGFSIDVEEQRKGPLLFSSQESIKPDYGNPNRKIKVGETWKKSMPQLVWFMMLENYEVVDKLINNGASANVSSDSGDTPILMALGTLNVTDVPYKSLDDRFFQLVSELEHSQKTINQRTLKLRLLPITSAVETGRPDVVKKILELGADPNGRGLTDEQTALNLCIKLVGVARNPGSFWKNQDAMPITPEVLDSIRRHSAGSTGFTLEHQQSFMTNSKDDPFYVRCAEIIKQMMTDRITERMSLENMREIAKLLIDNGADTNAEHTSPLKGYTPLMLAAELNERELFEYMLIKGGNPAKHYLDPRSGNKVNCWEIAKYFKSKAVQEVLDDIMHHFPSSVAH